MAICIRLGGLIWTGTNRPFKLQVFKPSWCHSFSQTPQLWGFFFWLSLIPVGSLILFEQSIKVKHFVGKRGALSAVTLCQ